MQILTLLIAAIGILIIPVLPRARATDEDEGFGLFVGSARPLPAMPQRVRSDEVHMARRPQKRSQLV